MLYQRNLILFLVRINIIKNKYNYYTIITIKEKCDFEQWNIIFLAIYNRIHKYKYLMKL